MINNKVYSYFDKKKKEIKKRKIKKVYWGLTRAPPYKHCITTLPRPPLKVKSICW
jgi:hypothetical protein